MSSPTAEQVYQQSVRALPAQEQLRLAALILGDLTRNNETNIAQTVDVSDTWSDADLQDISIFALRHATATSPDNEVEY